MNSSLHSRLPALQIIITIILGLLFAFIAGRWVGSGNYFYILIVFGAFFGLLTFLSLGDRYWYVIPLSLTSNLPALPLAGKTVTLPELMITGAAVIFVIRYAFKRQKLTLFRWSHLPVLLFFIWVGLGFTLNPVGLSVAGAEEGGGRFYVQIVLAFFSFIIMASQNYTEKDLRRIFYFLVIGVIIGSTWDIFSYFTGRGASATPSLDGDGYSWQQVMANPANVIALIIFSRFSPVEVFSLKRLPLVFVYGFCILLALASGKRMGLVAVAIAPVVSSLIYREKHSTILALLLAALGMGMLAAAQGNLVELPMMAQRSLSWLPGKWDSQFDNIEGGRDDFREELRRVARKDIQAHPIIGQGFAVDLKDTSAAIGEATYMGGISAMVLPYALGHSWHNTWLGYAADFGIPLSVIQGVLLLTVLVICWRNVAKFPHPGALQMFIAYVFIYTFRDVVASNTSGHVASDAFGRWWMYAVVFSLAASARQLAVPVSEETPPVIAETPTLKRGRRFHVSSR